jgi:hypothetical protein
VLKGAIKTLKLAPKPMWLLEICLEEFHPEGRNPDFQEIFDLFWDSGYQAFTATETPHLVSADAVNTWMEKGHSDSGTFNYIFVESEDVLNR